MKNMTVRHAGRARARGGFSLIEVLFAIGMLGIGIVGILALFTTGISAAAWSGNMTSAAMEAQSLYTRVISEVDPVSGKRKFLTMINDPDNPTVTPPDWIHNTTNSPAPELVDDGRDLWWQCRVSKFPMDKEEPLNKAKDGNNKAPAEQQLPNGLYQIAISVYRNYKNGKDPVVVYTTFVTAGY